MPDPQGRRPLSHTSSPRVDDREGGLRGGEYATVLLPVELTANDRRAPRHGHNRCLGVDRLDYTKGIPERLAAFEH